MNTAILWKKRKQFFLWGFIGIYIIIGCFFVFRQKNLGEQLDQQTKEIQSLKTLLQFTDKEVLDCINNSTSDHQSENQNYSYSLFGYYSPFYKDQNVNITTYLYKRVLLTHKSLVVRNSNSDDEYHTDVWIVSSLLSESNKQKIIGEFLHGIVENVTLLDESSYISKKGLRLVGGYGTVGTDTFGRVALYRRAVFPNMWIDFSIRFYSPLIRDIKNNLFTSDIVEKSRLLDEFVDTVDTKE